MFAAGGRRDCGGKEMKNEKKRLVEQEIFNIRLTNDKHPTKKGKLQQEKTNHCNSEGYTNDGQIQNLGLQTPAVQN